jgi:hypothetical protein
MGQAVDSQVLDQYEKETATDQEEKEEAQTIA